MASSNSLKALVGLLASECVDRFRGRHESKRRRPRRPCLDGVAQLESRIALNIQFSFDYSYDNGFFKNHPERRAVLEAAGDAWTSLLNDHLTEIRPDLYGKRQGDVQVGNHWTAGFNGPDVEKDKNGNVVRDKDGEIVFKHHEIADLFVPADTIIIYVGSAQLDGTTTGLGGPAGAGGTYSYPADNDWDKTVRARGKSGIVDDQAEDLSKPTSFSLWGGVVTFDDGTNWFFGASDETLQSGQSDFYSVAAHELGHVLGIGIADSFTKTWTDGTNFVGPAAEQVYGGQTPTGAPTPVPLNTDDDGSHGHWADGVQVDGKPTLMDPTTDSGHRTNISRLEVAALKDIGWTLAGTGQAEFTPGATLRGRVTNSLGSGIAGVDIYGVVSAGFAVSIFYLCTSNSSGYFDTGISEAIDEMSLAGTRGGNSDDLVFFADDIHFDPADSLSAGLGLAESFDLSAPPVAAEAPDGQLFIAAEDSVAINQIGMVRQGPDVLITVNGKSSRRAFGSFTSVNVGVGSSPATLTLDYSGGDFIPAGGFLAFDGSKSASAANRIIIQGTVFSELRYLANGPGRGTLSFGSGLVTFAGTTAIQLNAAVATLGITASSNDDQSISVDQDTTLTGYTQVAFSGGLARLSFAEASALDITSGAGNDVVTIGSANEPSPGTLVAVESGVAVDSGAGNDTLSVYGAGSGQMTNGFLAGLTTKPIAWEPATVENIILHNGDTQRTVLNNATIASALTLDDGVLQGTGTLQALSVTGQSAVKPGTPQFLAFGALQTGDFNLRLGQLFTEIQGPVAGASYDQVRVTGKVTLDFAVLHVNLDSFYLPPVGTTFTIIDNDGTDPVVGTFAGYAEGSVMSPDGATIVKVSYKGGDGNDVTLTVLNSRDSIGSVSVSPGTIKDDNSDTITLTANDISSPTGTLDYTYVTFYLDSNGNGAFDDADRVLFGGHNNGDGSFTGTGPITGVTPGTYKLFARASRYTYHDELFSDPVATTIQVVASPVVPAVAIPDGVETRINPVAAGAQGPVLLARFGDYNFAIYNEAASSSEHHVYLQRYFPLGDPDGGRVLLADANYTISHSAVAPDGSFVVVWSDAGQIFARRYAFDGTPLGALIQVSTSGLIQYDTAVISGRVAIDGQGDFIIAWVENVDSQYLTSEDVYYRRYYADGTPRDPAPIRANSSTTGAQIDIDVAMNASGAFAMTWNDRATFPSVARARIGTFGGDTLGSEFQVNTQPLDVSTPKVAIAPSGDFVIVMCTDRIYARRFANNGTPLDSQELSVHKSQATVAKPLVAMNASGYYVVAWNAAAQDPGDASYETGVYGQVFAPSGSKLGGEIHMSTSTAGFQRLDGLAMTPYLDFAVAWEGNGTVAGQEDPDGVFLQRFRPNLPPVLGTVPTQFVGVNSTRSIRPSLTDPEGGRVTITDIDGQAVDASGFVLLDSGAHLIVSNNGALLYVPSGLPVGAVDSFTYTASDGNSSVTGAINVRITEVFTIDRVSPALDEGLVKAGSTIDVRFTEPAAAESTASNYRIQAVGADGLLGTADDMTLPVSLHTDGLTTTLETGGLAAGQYRLTVLDSLTEDGGFPLDGDRDSHPGGAFVRDFVVLPESIVLGAPGGRLFDVQTAGAGAGSIVQANGTSVDGLNRLLVGGQEYAPPLPPVDIASVTLPAQVNVDAQPNGWYDVPGLTLTFTVDGANPVLINAGLGVRSDVEQNFAARILLDGSAPAVGGHIEAYPMRAGRWQSLDFDALQELTPGSHTVTVQAIWSSGGPVHYDRTPYSLGLIVREFNALRDSSGSVASADAGISGVQTVTPAPATWTDIPGLATTIDVDADNAVNIHALIATRSISVDQDFYARILVDGNESASAGRFEQYHLPAGVWHDFTLDDTLVLAPGTHSIVIQAYWSTGGAINYNEAPYSTLSVREFKQPTEVHVATTGLVDTPSVVAQSWLDVPGFSIDFFADNLDTATLAAQLGVFADVAQDFRLRLVIDDGDPDIGGYLQRDPLDAQTWTTVALQTSQRLSRGNHTAKLQMYWGTGGHTEINASPYSSFRVVLVKGTAPYRIADSGHTVVTGIQRVAGLNVQRAVTVPDGGSDDFVRTVDVFTNPGATDVTTRVRLVGNLGSDEATRVFATSSGDQVVSGEDLWFGADGGAARPTIHYLRGPAGLLPASVAVNGDSIEWAFDITVPAGQTVKLGELTVVADTEAAAIASANALASQTAFTGHAADFLSAADLQALANFQFRHATTTVVTSDHDSGATYGDLVTINASVVSDDASTGAATGTVQLSVDGSNVGGPVALVGGKANIPLPELLGVGAHDIAAVYRSNNALFFDSSTAGPTTLTIARAPLILTAVDATKVYGAALPSFTLTGSGFVAGQGIGNLTSAPVVTSTAAANSDVGTYTLAVNGVTDANYSISFVPGTLTVTPASLTIRADNQTMVAGSAIPVLTVQYTGFVNGDTSAKLDAVPVITTTATSSSPAGAYPINVTATSRNYTITVVAGTLTVTAAPQLPGSQPTAPQPLAQLALSAPATLRATGLTASFRRVSLTQAPSGTTLTVRLNTNVGKLQLKMRGVKIVGNKSGRLSVTGTQAVINRALKALTLLLPKRGARAKVLLTASGGGISKTATISIS